MFHDKPRKLETYLFWGQKAKGQGHEAQKNNARVGYFALLWVLTSSSCMFAMFYSYSFMFVCFICNIVSLADNAVISLYFAPLGDVLRSACLFVYLSHISKNACLNFINFSNMLPVVVARSFSDDIALCCVLPVLWTTSCFHITGPVDQNHARRSVSSSSPGVGTGGEVYHLWLHLIQTRCKCWQQPLAITQ